MIKTYKSRDIVTISKTIIPAIAGTDEVGQVYAPKNGSYKNTLVYYESDGKIYLYSYDGTYIDVDNVDQWNHTIYFGNGKEEVEIDVSEFQNKTFQEIWVLVKAKVDEYNGTDKNSDEVVLEKPEIMKIATPKKTRTSISLRPDKEVEPEVIFREENDEKPCFENKVKRCSCGRCKTCKDTLFRKVTIPASMGSDEPGQPHAPKNGAYRNALVTYEATGVSYMYSSDGVYTKIAEIDVISPVNSVNGQTGDVILDAEDVNALPNDTSYGYGLSVDGRSVTLVNQNGDEISTIETQDTTYTAGTGIDITDNVISSTQTSAEWGNIAGNIDDQIDLKNALNGKVDKVQGKGLSTNDFTDFYQQKLESLENYDDTEIRGEIADAQGDISTIEGKIPAQATSSNQLADKNFVNSSLNSITAFYITKDAQGTQFATKAELDATTTFYSGGEVRVPTRNDYCIVLADETKTDPVTGEKPTTRYIYQNGWEFQYVVNKTALTAAQLAAVNSGATSALIGQITTNQNNISTLSTSKQDTLISGTNIKTINSQSVLGSGDITIPTGVTDYLDLTNKPIDILDMEYNDIDINTLDNGAVYKVINPGGMYNDYGAYLYLDEGSILLKGDYGADYIGSSGVYWLDPAAATWDYSFCISQEEAELLVQNKEDALQIFDYPETSLVLSLGNNCEARFINPMTSLKITPVSISQYVASFAFTSGSTATSFDYVSSIKWQGDDCTNLMFVPAPNKRYYCMIWYDGSIYHGSVRGVPLS